ncbi:MAG: lytic transglycosylase domain-containing protein [Rhizobiales bacterium]|nr:lytic transglycosylase domain-containing protein [Hyphomicrobiales bacterium]
MSPGSAVAAIDALTAPAPGPAAAPTVTAYAPEATNPTAPTTDVPAAAPVAVAFPPHPEGAAIRNALDAYRKGDLAAGDQAAKNVIDPLARQALEWSALRLQARLAGPARLAAFADGNPQWRSQTFLRARTEDALYGDKNLAAVRRYFAHHEPVTSSGRLAQARLLLAEKHVKEATALVSRVWRQDDIGTWTENALQKEFGQLLTEQDHRFRSDRLFYKEKLAASMRVAALVSPAYVKLAQARNAVANEANADKLMNAVPQPLRSDATYQFARLQQFRRAGKLKEAAAVLDSIPDDPNVVVSGDDWWTERRLLARKLLDAGDAETAFQVAAKHNAESGEARIEAEFHAGWIALRFLNDPTRALGHFAAALEIAQTPISRARAAYWQARAAEKGDEPEDAGRLYAIAAEQSSTYYGQLARARLGLPDPPVRVADTVAQGEARDEPIRAVEMFLSIGEKDLAFRLTMELARTLEDKAQIAALADVTRRGDDARATLIVGKLASQRGVALDDIAFPTFGVPAFTPLARSADLPIVYSIARQESAFQGNALSHAGAKGLMQMMTPTARRTAQRAGVDFDESRLLGDVAFNAQLGAAHLADLLDDYNKSLILTFAAYNAGGKRVREWITAYGDPRKDGIDPIDWVERIPITETRNYVQRVVENLGMYRVRLNSATPMPRPVDTDLRAREARL